jgi:hypothetical protein
VLLLLLLLLLLLVLLQMVKCGCPPRSGTACASPAGMSSTSNV